MKTKIVCVTGASGYLASHIINQLLNSNYIVKALTRNKETFLKNNYPSLQKAINNKNIQNLSIVEYDFEKEKENSIESLIEILSNVHYLIHCASPVILQDYADKTINLEKIIEPAINYTQLLLTASSSTNIQKIVLTSSTCAIYDGSKTHYSCNDWADETKGLDAYSISKIRSEKVAWEIYHQTKKWELVVLNPGRIIGPTIYNHVPESFCSIQEAFKIAKNANINTTTSVVNNYCSSFCDVRDAAYLHIHALEYLHTNRYIIAFEIKEFKDYCEEILPENVYNTLQFNAPNDRFTFENSFQNYTYISFKHSIRDSIIPHLNIL